jgi:hypothetical protein
MRSRFIRSVFILAVLTTIATSAPEGFSRDDIDTVSLAPMDVRRVRVIFSVAASEQAEALDIQFDTTSSTPIMLVPDDPSLDAVDLTDFHAFDALAPCSLISGPCELAFTLDAGDANAAVTVSATASRAGDASFCFPDNRDFSDDATVEVIFE